MLPGRKTIGKTVNAIEQTFVASAQVNFPTARPDWLSVWPERLSTLPDLSSTWPDLAAPADLLKVVRGEVDKFVGDAPQFDDLTMLAIKFNGRN